MGIWLEPPSPDVPKLMGDVLRYRLPLASAEPNLRTTSHDPCHVRGYARTAWMEDNHSQ